MTGLSKRTRMKRDPAQNFSDDINRKKQRTPCDCWRCRHIATHPETSKPLSREELLSFLWRNLFDDRA